MTKQVDFDQALNNCLEHLREGEPIEACLASYPAYAERLAPLLHLAVRMHSQTAPPMSARGWQAGEARLLAQAAELRARQSARASAPVPIAVRPRFSRLRWLTIATMASIFLVCGLLSAGAVSASSSSLPGSPLYPLKIAVELAVSWAALTPQRQVSVHLTRADRRLHEVEAVLARDGLVEDMLLAALVLEIDHALSVAEQAGPEPLQTVLTHTEQQQVLSRLLAEAPPAARPGLQRALAAVAQEGARARDALEDATSDPLPTDVPATTAMPATPSGKPTTALATVAPIPVTATPVPPTATPATAETPTTTNDLDDELSLPDDAVPPTKTVLPDKARPPSDPGPPDKAGLPPDDPGPPAKPGPPDKAGLPPDDPGPPDEAGPSDDPGRPDDVGPPDR